MGLNMYVWGVRKATPEEVDAIHKDSDGDPAFADWCGKYGIYPDVEDECTQMGAADRWNGKEVRVSLQRAMSGDPDHSADIDLTMMDKRIYRILLREDF